MLKKKLTLRLLPLILLLLTGCSTHSGIRLFNYDLGSFFGGTPDYVTVQKGDTLYSIARRYNVPIRDMIEANGLRPPYTLNIGRVLKMPNARFHIVEKGDTVYNISKRYDVDMRSLSKLNNITAPYALRIGQRLVIPGSVVSSSTTPTTARKAATASKTSSWKASSAKKKTTSAAKKKTTRTTTTTVKNERPNSHGRYREKSFPTSARLPKGAIMTASTSKRLWAPRSKPPTQEQSPMPATNSEGSATLS